MLRALRLLLKPEGYRIEAAGSAAAVLQAVAEHDFDVALLDLNYVRGSTSGQEGLDLLFKIQQIDSTLPVVVMTAWSSVELAVEAMRRGARDFVTKPWKNERLLTILRTQVELGRALRKGRQLEQENLLLRSEARPLLIAETVFESELFGHVAGAFTDARTDRLGRFKLADRGTLFLDEIASIPVKLQSKLLRVLESGEFEPVGSSKTLRVDVRVLSATNADIDEEVRAGRFRQALLYRLQTIRIHVPALRQRREDIPLLAAHFLHRYAARYRKDLTGFDAASMQVLLDCSWPGNVRQLDHTVERAVLMAQEPLLRASDLGADGGGPAASIALGPTADMTDARRGEMLFHDADLCFQGWQNCASCHPDARADGLNWDLLNDGLGTPRNTRSMLWSHRTPPAMSLGVRETAEAAVRAGLHHIQFVVRPEVDAAAIGAYLKSIKPLPSPYAKDRDLIDKIQRGKGVFEKAGCQECHPSPLYTLLTPYDVGTGTGCRAGEAFDTPTLVELWRTAPYLHDGRAATLQEVFTRFNLEDRHGKTSNLSETEIDDLTAFLLSL